ncbi:MAG TPA: PAS domain S-box protein [Syntrophobacteraceae bacterium]|nr:PAS domain S-box protein [Syntrophobacteraceae bacterium]
MHFLSKLRTDYAKGNKRESGKIHAVGSKRGVVSLQAIILAGTIISFIGLALALSLDRQIIRAEFEKAAENHFETIKREIESNLHAVVSLKAFFDSTRDIDRPDFKEFAEPHLSLHPSVRAIAWVPLVHNFERFAYETTARQRDGFSDFQITEQETQGKMTRAAEREVYFPVYFVEPYKGNEIALGFDLASNATRKQALEKSRDTGEMVATGRITLVLETAGQFGFLAFAPVYRRDVTLDSIAARREHLKGFVLGVFRIGDIVEKSLAHLKPEGIDIYIYDKSADSQEQSFLYFHPSQTGKTVFSSKSKGDAGRHGYSDFENVRTLDFANREWMILIRSTPDFVSARKTWQPLGVLTTGVLLVTGMLAIYFILQKRARNRIEEQLNFLEVLVNTIPSPIFYKDVAGVYLGCNSAFEAYIGRSKAEVVGKTVYEVAPRELADVYRKADLALFNTPGTQQYDASVQYADGSRHDVIFSKATFTDSLGKAAGIVGMMSDITEQKRAEEDLKRTLAYLENVFENSPDGISIVDKHGKFIKWNRRAADLLQYTFEELEGKSAFALYADNDELDRMLTKLRREGAVRKYPISLRRKDGTASILEISIGLLKDDAEIVLGSVCVARDLSEVTKAMVALEASNKRLEQEIRERRKAEEDVSRVGRLYEVLSHISQAIVRIRSREELLSTVCRLVVERGAADLAWIGWLDSGTAAINPVAYYGNQAHMLSEARFHVSGQPQGQGNPGMAIREGKPFVCHECDSRRCPYPAERAPAHFGFQSCGSFPLRFQGKVSGVLTLYLTDKGSFQESQIEMLSEVAAEVSYALDKIESDSQREHLKEEYQQQSVFLETILDAMPCQVFYKDTQMRYLGCNRAYEAIVGLSRDQIIGRTAHDIWPKDLADLYQRADQALLANPDQQSLAYEEILERTEGIPRYYQTNKAIFRNREGAIAGIIGTTADITERKDAEAARLKSEELYRITFDSAGVGIAHVALNGRWLRVNRKLCEITGYSREELLRIDKKEITHPDDIDSDLAFIRQALAGEADTYSREKRYIKKDGSLVWISLTVALKRDDGGSPEFFISVYEDITEPKKAQQSLRESEAKFRSYIENSPLAVLVADREGRILDFNQSAVDLLGYDTGTLTGMSVDKIHPEEDREIILQDFATLLDKGHVEIERRVKRADGQIRWVSLRVVMISDQVSLGYCQDITESKIAETVLRENEQKFRAISDSAQDAVVMLDEQGTITFWNSAAERIFNYSAGEALGQNAHLLLAPQRYLEAHFAAFPGFKRTGGGMCVGKTIELNALRKGGEEFPIELSLSAFQMKGLWHAAGIIRDVSERKLTERTLQLQEERLRLAMEATQQGWFDLNVQTGQISLSPEGAEIMGYEPSRFETNLQAWIEGIHPEDRDAALEALKECIETGGTRTMEYRRRTHAGKWKWLRSIGKIVAFDSDKKPLRMTGTHADISEYKRTQEKLLASQKSFKELADMIPETIFEMDTTGKVTYVNQNVVRFGFSPEDFERGVSGFDLISPEDRPRALENAERIMKGEETGIAEYKVLKKDGSTFPAIINSVGKFHDGKPTGFRGIVVDISEKKKLEADLLQAQKMESLGTLAGGIAHDFNNILGIIMGFTQLAKWELNENHPQVVSKLDEVLNASDRAKELVKQILAFSRRSEQQKMPLQLGTVVKEAMKILRPSLPSTIEIKTDVRSESAVLADLTQMHQVLMNLCSNAAYAMQGNGGILDVRLADVELATGQIPCLQGLQPGRYVKLRVRDNGRGIDPSVMDLIFDPFFTTKEAGKGTGLGLSVVHGIVKSHGGTINVESTPGRGTTFTILIPALETDCEPTRVETSLPLPHGQERILVVDDEPSIVDMVTEMLENQGYDVVSCTSGAEALETFRHQSAEKPFDLVLTDMTMPRFTGVDLARELSALNPEVPVILMTGFSARIDADSAKEMGICGFLVKPVAMAELATTVRTVLDRIAKEGSAFHQ